MSAFNDTQLLALADICRRFGIAECSVFGSAATGPIERANDVDFSIRLAPGRVLDFDDYANLEAELRILVGKPVDVVNASFIRNPFFRRSVEATRRVLYAA